MHTKRFVAYLIDMIAITIFLTLIFSFFPMTDRMRKIQTQIDTLGSEYALGNVGKVDYFMELSSLEKKLDQEKAMETVINSIMIVIYFIFLPAFLKGATLGKKIMKIRIVDLEGENASLMSLFLRAFFMDGLLASLLLILGLYLIPANFYLSFVSILAVLQVLALITSFFMIKYRSDFMGLEDILSHSKVIKEGA